MVAVQSSHQRTEDVEKSGRIASRFLTTFFGLFVSGANEGSSELRSDGADFFEEGGKARLRRAQPPDEKKGGEKAFNAHAV